MPALITHHLFGEQSIDRLPQGVITSDEERIAFILGNQGPDPFFFRVRSLHIKAAMTLAHEMHNAHIAEQFRCLHDGVEHLQPRDAKLGRAFVLGLLSHYVLDRNAHPFVYEQQFGIIEADSELENLPSQVHAIIESDLDVLMLQLKRDGATCADYPPAGELVTTDRIDRVAGVLMSHVARQVFGLDVPAGEYGGAIADMQLCYRAIEPAGSFRDRVIAGVEDLVIGNSIMVPLSHRVTTETPARVGNLGHLPWRNPYTQDVSTESFPEVFDRALDDYEATVARFIEAGDMRAVARGLNYSGEPVED